MEYRISVDTGGTFTDVVVADAGGIRASGKALTTPARIFNGMRAAIEVAAEECGVSGKMLLRDATMLIYGTTRATNAVVTRSTARTAFLTTRGFRAADQERLQQLLITLASRGVHVLLSNSVAPSMTSLYEDNAAIADAGFRVWRFPARRSVNSRPDRRGLIEELVVSNIPPRPAFPEATAGLADPG